MVLNPVYPKLAYAMEAQLYDDGDPCNGLKPVIRKPVWKASTPLVCEDNDPCTINDCGTYGCISYLSADPLL